MQEWSTEASAASRRALSDAVRVRLWEQLLSGEATAKQLGSCLGLKPNRLYYHLRILEEAGLVEVVETVWSGRTAERVYAATHRGVSSKLAEAAPQERAMFFASLLDATKADLVEVVLAQAEGRQLDLRLARSYVAFSSDGFQRFVEGFHALLDDLREEDAEPTHRLTFALYALARLPADSDEGVR